MHATATHVKENKFLAYLNDYASYHKTLGNEVTHHVGIPVIMVAIMGLLSKIQLGPTFANGWAAIDVAFLSWIVLAAWYIWLDVKIGIPSAIVALGVYLIGKQIPVPYLIAMFIGGWIIQFIGHIKYEKNRPAFFKNFEHLLIGPIFVFGKWFRFLPSLDGHRAH